MFLLITRAQLEAIGTMIYVVVTLTAVGWLMYRWSAWLKHPTWIGFLEAIIDTLFSYGGFLLGKNLLVNEFIGTGIGLGMSFIVQGAMKKWIHKFASLLSKVFFPITWIGKHMPSHKTVNKIKKNREIYQEELRRYREEDWEEYDEEYEDVEAIRKSYREKIYDARYGIYNW